MDQLQLLKLWGFNPDLSTSDGKKRRAFCQFSPKSMTLKRGVCSASDLPVFKGGRKEIYKAMMKQELEKMVWAAALLKHSLPSLGKGRKYTIVWVCFPQAGLF